MLSKLEFRRQILHLLFGIFLVSMLYFGIFNVYHLVGILVLGITFSQLCARFNVPIATWVMNNFEREEFRKTFPGKGPIFFVLGSIIVLVLFPLEIALASMIILTVGDALAHIFGKLLQRKTYTYLKSVEGTVIGIVFSVFSAFLFVSFVPALLGAMFSLTFENLKLGVEDNLFVPIIAATVMSVLV